MCKAEIMEDVFFKKCYFGFEVFLLSFGYCDCINSKCLLYFTE